MSNLAHVFNGGFDANTVEPTTPFDVLPKGKYLVMISASEIKNTKAGDGQYLQLTHEVVDGQFKGRKVWARLNIANRNKTAEEIAHRTLSSLCRATGVLQLKDSSQLHNIPVVADIKVSKDGDQNDITSYAAANGAAPTPIRTGGFQPPKSQPASAPETTGSTTTTSPSNAGAVPPWKR